MSDVLLMLVSSKCQSITILDEISLFPTTNFKISTLSKSIVMERGGGLTRNSQHMYGFLHEWEASKTSKVSGTCARIFFIELL